MKKVALITGAAQGIGKRVALQLAESGIEVAISYLTREQEALALVEELSGFGVQAKAYQSDITRSEDNAALVQNVLRDFGQIDILINNAGPFKHERQTFSEFALDDVYYLMNGHFRGTMELDHHVLQTMKERKFGRILHIGFHHADEAKGYPLRSVYASSRVALVSFTKTLAVEESANNITVNMICPGDIRGDFKEMTISDATQKAKEKGLVRRLPTGGDIARLIEFLCQPESEMITGTIFDMSGGVDPIFAKMNSFKSRLG